MRPVERRELIVRGVVQGVGFRPFVRQLAARFGLSGSVQNRTGDVRIDVEGPGAALDSLAAALVADAPELARIDSVKSIPLPLAGARTFVIAPSDAEHRGAAVVAPDAATCDECSKEVLDPKARRCGYPFTTCTHCGPRLTIAIDAPWDRERTTMASFALCASCRAEYEDPDDRRFHAEALACRRCGPTLTFAGPASDSTPPLESAAAMLDRGGIVAIKGIGGHHLACRADDERAVAELRRRKRREAKPFALMARDLDAVHEIALVNDVEARTLSSWRRPIVLLARRAGATVARSVAAKSPRLGVMLPYAPLHHLLFARLEARVLVMTSGNRSDEPIAFEDADAAERLSDIADGLLGHDRPIRTGCDDSIVRVDHRVAVVLRRSRGYAPEPVSIPIAFDVPTLAVGGHLKSTFALGRGSEVIASHHLGDLDDIRACDAFASTVERYERLFGHATARIVHDAHPDLASTRYALERASREGLDVLAVQHHHAHLASCLLDTGHEGEAIGVAFDGAGLGSDGAIWGGEVLVGDAAGVRRVAHLAYVGQPGGDAAAREPWRMAVSHLLAAGEPLDAVRGVAAASAIRIVERMIERGVNTPPTSSVGRLFDAVSAIVTRRASARFEAEAAIELEDAAARSGADGAYPFDLAMPEDGPWRMDPGPMIRAIAADVRRGEPAADVARRFHNTLAEMIASTCERVRSRGGPSTVALTGGVFANALLSDATERRLTAAGLEVLSHRRIPPNDGGLSFGQLAVAAARCAATLDTRGVRGATSAATRGAPCA